MKWSLRGLVSHPSVITILLLPLIASFPKGAAADTFTSCYLYYGDVSDLSFTYEFNDARILAHAQLINAFTLDLNSNAYSDFETVANKTYALESLITRDSCTLIISTRPELLAGLDMLSFASRFTNVSFVECTNGFTWPVGRTQSNYANYILQMPQYLFMAGAMASKQSSTCVSFIYPSASLGWQADAFYRGFLWANSSTPLYVASLDDDNSSTSELQLISLFVQKGCDVLASTTPNNVLSTAIAALNDDTMMSIGYGSDASLIAGDSVLTSMYTMLSDLFFTITSDAIARYVGNTSALPRNTYVVNTSSQLILAELSPRATAGLVQLATSVRNYVDITDTSCATFVDRDGATHSGCLPEVSKLSYPYLDSRIHVMSSWRSPFQCSAGTTFSYTLSDFSLTCVSCPIGTYSKVSGSANCTMCDSGLVSLMGSASCSVPGVSTFDLVLIVPIVLGGLVSILIVVVVVVCLLRGRVEASRDPANAPRGPMVAMAMIGVDNTLSDRQWRSSLTNMCDVYDRLAGIVIPAANRRKVYIFVSVGDVVMVAARSPQVLVELLGDVNQYARWTRWPCKIRLKLALHYGKPFVGESRRISGEDEVRVTYTGADVDLLRALWRREVSGSSGDMLMTEAAFADINGHHMLSSEDPDGFHVSQVVECTPDDKLGPVNIVHLTFNSSSEDSMHAEMSAAVNPLDVAQNGENETDSRRGMSTNSESSEGVEDDLARLVTPSAISKEELESLRTLGVDLLQKFLRVFTFDDQVSIVVAIAKKLHVQTPKIPEMKTTAKKSFNVLRNSLKHICNQLLMSIDEKELQHWLDTVAAHVQKRESVEINEDHRAERTMEPLQQTGVMKDGLSQLPAAPATVGAVSSPFGADS